MKKMLIAVAVLALAATMIIPVSVFADDSDAGSVAKGEDGLSVEISTDSDTEIKKFYSQDDQNNKAKYLLMSKVIQQPGKYDFSDVKMTKLEFKKGLAAKYTDDTVEFGFGQSVVYTMTFTAKANETFLSPTPGPLLYTNVGELIKYVDIDNVNRSSGEFKVTVTVEEVYEMFSTNDYIMTNENKVLGKENTWERRIYTKYDFDVEYKYKLNGTEVSKEFTYVYEDENAQKVTEKFDFNDVDEKQVKSDTVVFKSTSTSENVVYTEEKYTFDGSTYVIRDDAGTSSNDFSRYQLASAEALVDYDITFPTFNYYGDDPSESLFTNDMVEDSTLKSNEAMKNYLQENGKVGTTYADAESVVEDMAYTSGSSGNNLLLFIGIGAGVIVIIAVAAVVFLKLKK